MSVNTAEQLNQIEGDAPNAPVAIVALQSQTLTQVIQARLWLCGGLILAALAAMTAGTLIILYGPSGTEAAQIIEAGNFKISSSGFGAIFMTTSLLFGYFAYRSRPRLDLYPTARGASVSIDGRVSDSGGPDDDEPPPESPAGFGASGVNSARLHGAASASSPPFQVSFPQKNTDGGGVRDAADNSDGDDDDPPPSAPAGAGTGLGGSARALTGRVLGFSRSKRK